MRIMFLSKARLKELRTETPLSIAQLARINKTICIHLNYPENLVGLEGWCKHQDAWEAWLDDFIDPVLDAANIGGSEVFWGTGDRIALRKLVSSFVSGAAGSVRNHLRKGSLPHWMGEASTAYQPPTLPTDPDNYGGYGGSDIDSPDTEDLSEYGSEVDLSTTLSPTSNPQPGSVPAKKRRKTDPGTFNRAVTFLTRLQIPDTDVVRHEFVDTAGIFTLNSFIKLLRKSNGMLPQQRINGFEVEIAGRTVDVNVDDPEREWEWGLVLGILHFSGVPDGQKVYVDIRVDV